MDNYADHLFTDAVQAEQEKAGMRDRYAAVYEQRLRDPFDARARDFIEACETSFIASYGANGWPYVNHRGGPPGFIHVTGPEQVAFADYTGNKQFITKGNLHTDTRVSLILMDYANSARLKLLGTAKMVEAADDPALAKRLETEGQGPVERLVTIDVAAMDWNCPKYITPRFTEAEIHKLLAPRMAAIDDQITILANRLSELGEDPAALIAATKDTK